MSNPQLLCYYAVGSNASDRVRWALAYKGLQCQWVDEADVPPEVRPIFNPFGRVPSLMVGQQTLTESMAICEYLEAVAPEPTLLPGDDFARARIREVCDYVSSTVHPAQSATVLRHFAPGADASTRTRLRVAWLNQALRDLRTLAFRDSAFAAATAFSLADIFVACVFARAVGLGLDVAEWGDYASHLRGLMTDPQIAGTCPIRPEIVARIVGG